jgi:hypothetical protein
MNARSAPQEEQKYEAINNPTVYLSHVYFQRRWDTVDTGTHGLATSKHGYGPEPSCMQTEEEIDLTKEVIRSRGVKMSLPISVKTEQDM